MNEPQWPAFADEEWTRFLSSTLVSHPDHSHPSLFATSFDQNSQPVDQLVYPGHQIVTTPNDPAMGSVQTIGSVTADFEKLGIHPSPLVPPTVNQWSLLLDVQRPLPPNNEFLASSTIAPPILPPTSTMNPEPAHEALQEDFIKRSTSGYICTWTGNHGDICGFTSRLGLVKRHAKRVHLGMRYEAPATKKDLCGH